MGRLRPRKDAAANMTSLLSDSIRVALLRVLHGIERANWLVLEE